MADLLGPKGKQIPDHSLEVADLPILPPGALLVAKADGTVVAAKFVTSNGAILIDGNGDPIYVLA